MDTKNPGRLFFRNDESNYTTAAFPGKGKKLFHEYCLLILFGMPEPIGNTGGWIVLVNRSFLVVLISLAKRLYIAQT